jgi:hypothetical protein
MRLRCEVVATSVRMELRKCEISGSHRMDCEDYSVIGCDAV